MPVRLPLAEVQHAGSPILGLDRGDAQVSDATSHPP